MYPDSIRSAKEDASAHALGDQESRCRPFKGKAVTHRSGFQQVFSRIPLLIRRQSIRRANEEAFGTHSLRTERGDPLTRLLLHGVGTRRGESNHGTRPSSHGSSSHPRSTSTGSRQDTEPRT